MRSITFVSEGKGAQDYYRCRLMARGLERIGWRAHLAGGVVERPDGRLRGLVDPRTRTFSPLTEIVVLRMVADPVIPAIVAQARERGQVVVYDIDDPIWLLPEWNPAHATYFGPDGDKRRQMVAECMAACSFVTTTTARAAQMVTDVLGTGTSPVRIVDNGVDIRSYPRRSYEPHDPLRVAWLGRTDYRGEDLRSVADQLRSAFEELGTRVMLYHVGWHKDDPQIEDVLGLPPGRVGIVKRPWVELDKLPAVLAELDLVLLPQRRCEFAEARSTATGLACAAAGTPFLSTATKPYLDLSFEGAGDCVEDDSWADLLVWYCDNLDRLTRLSDLLVWYCDNLDRLTRLSVTGREVAWAHDIEATARAWVEAVG